MPSDQYNWTMAIATGWFIYCFTLLHPETCLFDKYSSSNACIMVLPKLAFILLCASFFSLPLLYCVNDILCFASSVRLDQCSAIRGTSYTILCLECVSNAFEVAGKKVYWLQHGWVTHSFSLIANLAHGLMSKYSVFMYWLDWL